MDNRVMYFIVNTRNPKFSKLLEEAEIANIANANGAVLSWFYNDDESKAEIKVVGASNDWYANSPWFEHRMILSSYTPSQHPDLLIELQNPEWNIYNTDSPSGGSPA